MKRILWSCLLGVLLLPIAISVPAEARPGGGFACPDVYAPVLCSDGNVYSNGCYASVAGATGCVPYDDFIVEAAANLNLCPGGFECLDVWDPVICSNGVVYSNACYARRACATGCGPYGDI